MDYSQCIAVYFNSEEIVKDDIVWGLLELGIEVERPEYRVPLQEYQEEQVEQILPLIVQRTFVITQDFSAVVARACDAAHIPYISWVYDSPQRSLYLKEALLPMNYIFVFDKKQCERLKAIGIQHVFHQPLAGNIAKASILKITDEDIEKYSSDISFVGQMYQRSYQESFFRCAPPEAKEQFDLFFSKTVCNWKKGCTIFNQLGPDANEYMLRGLIEQDYNNYRIDKKYAGEVLIVATTIAGMERKAVLCEAAQLGQCDLYTNSLVEEKAFANVRIHPPIDYNSEIYKVYFSSKINLNITMRAIESGIPQRIFDIMSVGGFVLTNEQEEIEELFTPGVDLVTFQSLDEMKDKIGYYLSHERERIRIAMNGYQKVRDYYSYPHQLTTILKNLGIG